MSNRPKTAPDAAAADRRSLLLCSSLIAQWRVATDPEFFHEPIVREQLDAFAEIDSLYRQLAARGLPWPDVLSKMRDWCDNRPMPLLDALRRRNDLTTTFGQETVIRSVERELAPR